MQDAQIARVGRAGLLTGVPPFDLGIGLGVRPSVTTGAEIPAPGPGLRGHGRTSSWDRAGRDSLRERAAWMAWRPARAWACFVSSSFVQYDTESRRVGTNTRLRWTLCPAVLMRRIPVCVSPSPGIGLAHCFARCRASLCAGRIRSRHRDSRCNEPCHVRFYFAPDGARGGPV